jgi:peptidoglycan/xylan/chitin deacetylase (PgdA/CDA1 family)
MTFYINSSNNWAAGYDDTWRDALAQGDEIANHTVHHCHPPELTDGDATTCPNALATMEEEIDQCSAYIATPIGQSEVWTFAYPYGDLGYKDAAAARFFLARGVQQGTVGPNDASDPFNLPIIAHTGDPTVPGGDPVTLFNTDIDNAVAQGRWLIYLLHSILPTTNNWYAGEDIAAITGSIEHAKELGNVWLDSVVNIGAYWLGQRTFQAVTPVTADGKTTWTWTLPEHFPPGHFLRVAVDGGALSQAEQRLTWDGHGYYEVALDAGTLEWSP